jgi:hypothetical protein
MDNPNLLTRAMRKATAWTHTFDIRGTKRDRAVQLLATVGATLFVLITIERISTWHVFGPFKEFIKSSLIFGPLLFPEGTIEWKDRQQALIIMLGLPVAFLLWHWRDRNVRDQIDNAKSDLNLKEFQDVQLRAAGAIDKDLPIATREQLQIAALHHLKGFILGEYGQRFRKPAFELLMAGHKSSVKTTIESFIKINGDDLDHLSLDIIKSNMDIIGIERIKIPVYPLDAC